MAAGGTDRLREIYDIVALIERSDDKLIKHRSYKVRSNMFKWLRKKPEKQKLLSESKNLEKANIEYFEAVIRSADRQFASVWKFDSSWIGVLEVASDLDYSRNNTEKMDEITSFVIDGFLKGMNADQCAAMLLLRHAANQRQLEMMVRAGLARRAN